MSKLRRRLFDLRNNEDEYLYDSEEERIQKTKRAISIFVKSAIEKQYCSTSFVEKKLKELYQDCLIHTKEVLEFGISEVEKFRCSKRIQPSTSPSSAAEQPNKYSSLFCKENVYHACLCCKAISTCSHKNIKEFFMDKLQSNDHKLEEVSMSLSGHYLIAKSQNTLIFAFSGEKSFMSWFERCENYQDECGYQFEKGMRCTRMHSKFYEYENVWQNLTFVVLVLHITYCMLHCMVELNMSRFNYNSPLRFLFCIQPIEFYLII